MDYKKPQSTIMQGNVGIYPLTTADQVILADGSRLEKDGKISADSASDSSKLGGKAPKYYIQPRNLLDNSDFRNPVNQRGQTSYKTAGYTIDRWLIEYANPEVTVNSGYVTLKNINDTYKYHFKQRIAYGTLKAEQKYTIALKTHEGDVFCSVITAKNGSIEYSGNLDNFSLGIGKDESIGFDLVTVFLQPLKELNIDWIVLYEGSYTAESLPPYVPKGYAAELTECQRYAYLVPSYMVFSGYITSSSKNFVFSVPCPPMRNADVKPTVASIPRMTIRTISGYSSIATWDSPGTPSSLTVQDYHSDSYEMDLCAVFSSDIGTNNTPAVAQFRLGDSALISLDL